MLINPAEALVTLMGYQHRASRCSNSGIVWMIPAER
jgi:hypothetical protein